MSEAAAAVDKTLFAFLNGLAKRLYFKELEFSDEFLRNDVLGGISEEEYQVKLKRFSGLLNGLVSSDMDFTQLDAYLSSQMRKKQGALSETEAATITRFWKSQKSKIHQRLVEDNMWGRRLKGSSWRIDVKTKARHIEQLNEPTAIMELQLGSEESEKADEVLRFEVDSSKLSELLAQVSDIEKALETHSHVS
ncbi:COMM domain-containing protein 1-like [Halichondria panicea]|uniref:COMM domain-containing protein 1-like n=1 Tax=Halichondria panicea TaxID=6063 RepID=UPI00312B4BD9